MHTNGTDHVIPEVGSRGYIRVVDRGCSTTEDRDGDTRCDHDYTWNCEDCPVVASRRFGHPDVVSP